MFRLVPSLTTPSDDKMAGVGAISRSARILSRIVSPTSLAAAKRTYTQNQSERFSPGTATEGETTPSETPLTTDK